MGPRRRYKDQVRYRAAYALGRIGTAVCLLLRKRLEVTIEGLD